MKDKTQDVNSLEELSKAANALQKCIVVFGNELSRALDDIKELKKEEDTWEMKCPYGYGKKCYFLQSSGQVFPDCWYGIESDYGYLSQGNAFPTEQAAELEAKRRNLLTRFKAFRDECNGDWEIDWNDVYQDKHIIKRDKEGNFLIVKYWTVNEFNLFGYFKDYKDAKRAIELFGDEITELFVKGDA